MGGSGEMVVLEGVIFLANDFYFILDRSNRRLIEEGFVLFRFLWVFFCWNVVLLFEWFKGICY